MRKHIFFLYLRDQDCPVMATVNGFVQSASDELLNSCTKRQLLKLYVEHCDIDIGE